MIGQKKSAQKNLPSKTQKVLVRPTGLEPVLCHHKQILSLLRLPFRHAG